MKKKFAVVALFSVMALGLTACGKEEIEILDGPGSVVEEPETEEEPETDEPETEDPTEVLGGELKVIELEPDVSTTFNDKSLTFYEEYDDEYEESGIAKLSYGDESYAVCYATWVTDSYLIYDTSDDPETFYVLVTLLDYNDWRSSILVAHEGSDFYNCDDVDGGALSIDDVNGNNITLHSRIDCLGTYGTEVVYDISEGKFKTNDAIIPFYNATETTDGSFYDDFTDEDSLAYAKSVYDENGKSILTAAQAFDAFTESGESVEIEAGSILYPTAYDPTACCFYFDMDGAPYYLCYEYDESTGTTSINGVDAFDLFVNLPYSG